ncbi:MAG: hotdog domain-containing protein [Polyangiales bacterium]
MEANTHLEANSALIGVAVELAEGRASASLDTIDSMVVDERGLVHGGFVFGLADYAAMLAVNDPNVVLGAATTRFLKPVAVGSRVVAQARVVERDGRKRQVEVEARVDSTQVFEGTFVCFVLEHHVLDTTRSK